MSHLNCRPVPSPKRPIRSFHIAERGGTLQMDAAEQAAMAKASAAAAAAAVVVVQPAAPQPAAASAASRDLSSVEASNDLWLVTQSSVCALTCKLAQYTTVRVVSCPVSRPATTCGW
jgi:hypothetical protein